DGRKSARAAFEAGSAESARRLRDYAASLISDRRDGEVLEQYRAASDEWNGDARRIMALAGEGKTDGAVALLHGRAMQLGESLGTTSQEWIRHNEDLATRAAQSLIADVARARRDTLLAVGAALLLSGFLGYLTFRRIVRPIRSLQTTVEAIAGGDYAKAVPFTNASDETGDLARAIDILKQGAMAMEEQRWVKTHAARLTGGLQGASSYSEFGSRLLSELVPLVGGGGAALLRCRGGP